MQRMLLKEVPVIAVLSGLDPAEADNLSDNQVGRWVGRKVGR